MYSVFVVDDEVLVREGLRKKIDWEGNGFTFAGEAGDGEIALSMIQEIKPEILITDIRMPFMDGLELARNVKKIQPWIRIIILSGHDEFDYAKKAISIGVEDYILKPFTPEEILESLKKTAAALDEQKSAFSDIDRMKKEIEANNNLSRDKMLSDLVLGTLGREAVMQKASELGINLISHYYTVTSSGIKISGETDINHLVQAKSLILSFAKTQKDLIGFFISPNEFVSIIKGNDAAACEESAFALAQALNHEIEQVSDTSILTAISPAVEHLANIPNAYKDASRIIHENRFEGKSRIVSVNDISSHKEELSLVLQENDPLVVRLNYADESEIDRIVQEYVELLGENTGSFSLIANYLLVDVVMAISKLIEKLGGDIKQVMPEILTQEFLDNAVRNQEVFISEVKKVLVKVLSYRDSTSQGRYNDVILRAKKYIEKNYGNPDVCLSSVAGEVALSPNHFSTVFSQDCGITFIEYLTQVRIEQAKKLLKNSEKKSADIAYEVGFNDPHYFSFIFKKETGFSPREWRQNQQ